MVLPLKGASAMVSRAGSHDVTTKARLRALQSSAEDVVAQAARRGNIPNPIVRDTLPDVDLDPGDDTGWNGTDEVWETMPTGIADADDDIEEYEIYDVDSDGGNAERRAMAFYGVIGIENADTLIEVRVRDSSGRLLERAQVQGLVDIEDADGMSEYTTTFSSPFLFDVQDNRTISIVVDEDDLETDTTDLVFKPLMVTGEKAGRTIGDAN